jgi:hypothetical protein
MHRAATLGLVLAALAAPALSSRFAAAADPPGSGSTRVYELRTYYTLPGRLDALNKRFRDHTCKLFQKHGMELVGFWTPQDEKDGKTNKLVYILAFPSRDAAKKSWEAFRTDPDWIKARDASEQDGKIVERVESVFLDPTDYSALK